MTRHERQTAERQEWIADAIAYMFEIGLYRLDQRDYAFLLADSLHYDNKDEGGEMMCTPKEAVDEELTYWGD